MIKSLTLALLYICIGCSSGLLAKVRLPAIVSDSMVLQRDTKLRVWGWADTGEIVRVSFKGKNYTGKTDASGRWSVWIAPSGAGGPYSMEISSRQSHIIIKDILIGEVWMCAGQSNMVHYLDLHKQRYATEISGANYPAIRQFLVPTSANLEGPAENIADTNWKAATPGNVLRFSVVAYFFAKQLYDTYGVPVGLINASVGGTPVEAWTSEEGLKKFPSLLSTIQMNKDTAYVNGENRKAAIYRQHAAKNEPRDLGTASSPPWFSQEYSARDWKRIAIPGYWEDQGLKNLDGVVWYRKDVDIPTSMTTTAAMISMGRMVDADNVYVNGELIGSTSYQYPQRRYTVPAGTLKPGSNSIVIRVTNQHSKGGFVPDKPYFISAGGDTISLAGYWSYKVGAVFRNTSSGVHEISAQNQPAALYNGMVAPLTGYAMRGILWYQGESNSEYPQEYDSLLPALINDWRQQWHSENMPFLFVQLPNYMDVDYSPSESNWARLRESQRKALAIDHTAMVVSIDLGEWNDIHPGNKKPIGERLALAARAIAYHEKGIVYSGPDYKSFTHNENKVILTFDHIGTGLIAKDGEALKWFAVAGENKKFYWANAIIDNDKVVVWSDEVRNPVYVRYAWADNPEGANLYNREGLLASPFEARLYDASQRWHGKRAAVVLTYDDALEVHLDNVIPALDSLGLKGTFYLSASFPGCKNRIDDWKRAARHGHELGNHTLYHPCDASKPGRSWVAPGNDLSQYTTAQIAREIEMTNVFLNSLDGKSERTFAYPCGDTHAKDGSYIEAIKNQFVAMRGVKGSLNTIDDLDLNNLNCYVVDESNADQLMEWAEKAKTENALLVVLFHGVGGGHSINVDLKHHHDFLNYLKDHEDEFWITTMVEASRDCIQQLQK